MKFSIITPTWDRADGRLQRCIRSVRTQQYRDFEHIIVDDGSEDGTAEIVRGACELDDRLRYLPGEHSGRVVARNRGMRVARGEWIVWLDSDDVLDPLYLQTFADNIERQPEALLWVCGAVVHGMERDAQGVHTIPKWTDLRKAWRPPPDESGRGWVHGHFPSGTVGTGMFVFRKECLEKTGYMPAWEDFCEMADEVDEWLGYTTGYSCEKKWVGNPWGDDWVMFRRLTQFYRVFLIDVCLYVNYIR